MAEVKKLTRDTDNKVLGGVCSGIANYFELDPVIIRVLWVILAFTGGAGIPAYIIAWLIMPPKGTAETQR